ncbi:MAG: hypothetical protein JWL95_1402 [Gemmatimonadetes bacterium]|nr:hypothetical protein [Gemmatimonadota bacterium]
MKALELAQWPRRTQIAAVALAASLLLDVGLALRLFRPSNHEIAFEPLVIRAVPHVAVKSANDAHLIQEAEQRAPFGGTAPVSVAASVVPQAPGQPRLVGTVVAGHAGFVIVEMPDTRLQIVRIGDRAGDLRLRSVAAGVAVFQDTAGARVTLRSPPGGAESHP